MKVSEFELGQLYRYRPYRADELRLLLSGGQLRFSDANFFNDPWDCRPLISIPSMLDQQAENERWIGWLAVAKLGRAVSEESAEEYRAKLRRDRAFLHSEVAIAGKLAIKATRDSYRVLCLSAHCNIPLMWSHYAASHTGLCQIFDTRDEVIDQAEEVIYLPSCPGLDFARENLDVLTPAFLTKAEYWRHEREFRVIAKESATGRTAFVPCHQGYVEIKPAALLGLILGCQMNRAHQEEAIAIAGAANHKVRIYEAKLDESSYQLRIVEKR